MLNGQIMLLQILLVLFIISVASGQNVEVLKAELKGMEGRLDAKIDGVKDTLDAKIDGAKGTLDQKITGTKDELTTGINGIKDELTASIDGVKSEVVTIKWIIGIASGVFVAFLGFVGHLLNHYYSLDSFNFFTVVFELYKTPKASLFHNQNFTPPPIKNYGVL